MADPTNPMYDPRCNHDLPIPGAGCNRDMWTCRYPECMYPEAAGGVVTGDPEPVRMPVGDGCVIPRRLRTQAERDADGTTWSAPLLAEATRWRVVLPAGVLKGITEADAYRLAAEHNVRPDRSVVRLYADGTEELGPWSPAPMPKPPPDLSWLQTEPAPRRRWWHRYTRRNP